MQCSVFLVVVMFVVEVSSVPFVVAVVAENTEVVANVSVPVGEGASFGICIIFVFGAGNECCIETVGIGPMYSSKVTSSAKKL
mmetsp:Transcript_7534/g.15634  ORF Transcript_7534/g.15634 Transcript_7534/m.15634 type:complete len:83 (+) Transcript_7534:994-1242(+)